MKLSRLPGLFLLIGSTAFAAPLLDEPLATLTLKSGTVLHEAQAKSFAGSSVMVKHRDGAQTVPYSQFPDEYQEALLAKRPAASTASAMSASGPVPRPKNPAPAMSKVQTPKAHPLMVQTFRVLEDCAAVEVYNESTQTIGMAPFALVGEVGSGETVVGRRFVMVDDSGKIVGTLSSRQNIGPKQSITLHVAFERPPQGSSISRVSFRN